MGRQLVVIIQEHAARDAAAGGATCQQSKKKGEAGWGEIHAVPGPAAASACCPLHVATLACILVYLRSSCMRARCGERTARGLDHVPTQVFRKPFQGERATRAHPATHTHTHHPVLSGYDCAPYADIHRTALGRPLARARVPLPAAAAAWRARLRLRPRTRRGTA